MQNIGTSYSFTECVFACVCAQGDGPPQALALAAIQDAANALGWVCIGLEEQLDVIQRQQGLYMCFMCAFLSVRWVCIGLEEVAGRPYQDADADS